MLHELFEQQELQPGEGHRATSHVGLEPADIEAQLPGPEDLVTGVDAELTRTRASSSSSANGFVR